MRRDANGFSGPASALALWCRYKIGRFLLGAPPINAIGSTEIGLTGATRPCRQREG
jgi:hypothetical protein